MTIGPVKVLAELESSSTPLPAGRVNCSPEMLFERLTVGSPAIAPSAPPCRNTVPVPRAVLRPISVEPAWRKVPPLKLLEPLIIQVGVPVLPLAGVGWTIIELVIEGP